MSLAQETAATTSGVQDALIVLVPVISMLAGSVATFVGKPSERTEARFQRLSAGLLVGAVVLDIWPETQVQLAMGRRGEISTTWTIVFGAVGFLLAVALMYGLKSLELEGEEEEEKELEDKLEGCASKKAEEADPELGEVDSERTTATPVEADAELGEVSSASSIVTPVEASPADAVAAVSEKTEEKDGKEGKLAARAALATVPWSFVLAVVVDAGVDGLLVGISAAVSVKSGRLMAIASGIEMGFLGYSYGRAILNSARNAAGYGLMALPPLVMFAAALAAAAAASSLASSPAFAGVLAFALVALLFLVFEELFPESAEVEGAEKWHIGGFLYFGILIAIILDQTL